MKRIIEDNYLGFTLEIIIDSTNRTVYGNLQEVIELPWGERDVDTIYSAVATCHPEDKFTEIQGIKLVKLKLAKQYHADMKYLYGDTVRTTKKFLSDTEEIYNYHLKKLENIESTLKKDYEMTFKKRPEKKSKATKSGKKKSK